MNTTATILVTGVNGFVGQHLAKELHTKGNKVIGVGSQAMPAPEVGKLLGKYISCDLTDADSVKNLSLKDVTTIIHLAAMASQKRSFSNPAETITANSTMVINLFEQALRQKAKPRFVLVSSAAVYDPEQEMPLTEQSALGSNTPYAISKALCEQLSAYYAKYGLEYVIARPFNHTGPGQGLGYLVSDLTKEILQMGAGEVIQTGPLTARRDFSDVRDVVRAYELLATAPQLPHHIYNICSGKSYSGEEVLELIARAAHGPHHGVTTKLDPAKVRPFEPSDITGSYERIRQDFGWEPQIPLEQTITDFVNWARSQAS